MTIARRRAAARVLPAFSGALRDARRSWDTRAWAGVVLFTLACAVPAIVNDPVSLSRLASGLYIALAAVGLNFTVRLTGMPSLGQGAFVGAGVFTTAWLRDHGGVGPIPAAVCGWDAAF